MAREHFILTIRRNDEVMKVNGSSFYDIMENRRWPRDPFKDLLGGTSEKYPVLSYPWPSLSPALYL
ncbi:uncharacterized protein LDX57_005865 [Aspergillus melleus]|uniref:uncharacterized protein n=1 Tax=Aspergillus melleus TaxID=138277 RepID=UPI001E8D0875|nr:uncharacterized protein LDX57_005865 [Aspergillus melleus]KAH8428160.1 hypothetical protein LDX57_005865 [Aspergillus melleus]